jgi:hypothetical protein
MCREPSIKPTLHRLKYIRRGVVLSGLACASQRRAAACNEFLLSFAPLRSFHCSLFDKLRQRLALAQNALNLMPDGERDAHWR